MSLFQNTVLNKYLGNLDPHLTEEKYKLFTSYFNNPEIRTNILNSKEEQFQEGFLISLFVNILGYTINPNPGFNLITEFKNEKDSRKSDAAIIINNTVTGIIELKGTEIIDLTKIENQAFGYKNNHPEAVYVITSNFRKIRLYIDNAVNFNEFDLFDLSFQEFKVLYLSLSFASLSAGIPLKIKQESLVREENISRQLYNDYSVFKRNLFNNLITLNPQIDQLTLFKKTQKLLDRFLFIFFAEDRMLLPANSIRNILSQWLQLKDLDQYVPLYDRIKKFFSYLNTGYKSSNMEIFPYNGGLFRPDEVLDNITIDDEVLRTNTVTLSNYDFNTEIDVNILGHIFENSLNEIEEITLSIQGKEIDKSKTKRKKEGVFYTPKYITSYIVKNTLGSLCNEIKNELGIIEEDYSPENKSKDTRRKLVNTLDAYRERLLKITICDPACGSGAFLNQALDYLINEHKYIDELKAKLLGESLILSDIENSILENNLFGVDINEESVEIAKLSLWLRTARKNRKLNNLSGNIKCGNSLIDDPAIAGEKAFNWHKEFPQVFAKGGFDIIIGNPPYVRQELLGNYKEYFSKNYRVFNYSSDLFAYFYEKAFLLLKQKGLLGFISNTFDKTTAGSDLRAFLQNNIKVEKYVDFTEVQIFEGATTYPIILIASNYFIEDNSFLFIKIPKNTSPSLIDIYHLPSVTVMQQSLNSSNWTFHSIGSNALLNKINLHENIRTQYGKCFRGIVTGFNLAFIISKSEKDSILMESPADEEIIKPFYEGKDLSKWYSPDIEKYLIFTKRGINIDKYPGVKNWLGKFRTSLEPKSNPEQTQGRKPGLYQWYEIQDSVDYYKLFENSKITWPNLQNSNKFCFEDKGYYINAPSVIFPSDNIALLAILNSKLVWFYLQSVCVVRNGGYIEVKPQYFEQIPIPYISKDNQQPFIEMADLMLSLHKELNTLKDNFLKFIISQFDFQTTSKKLDNWNLLDPKQFITELKKNLKTEKKQDLSKSDELRWFTLFSEQKAGTDIIQTQINQTDTEINKMVYELYGLSEEEIKIVEGKEPN